MIGRKAKSSPKKIALPMKPDAANRTAEFSDQYDRMDATACGAVSVTARDVGVANMVLLDLSSTQWCCASLHASYLLATSFTSLLNLLRSSGFLQT